MNNKISSILVHLVVILISLTSCNSNKLIKDKYLREDINSRFELLRKFAENRSDQLFQVFSDSSLSRAEEEGLRFYLASMPLNDLADYDSRFFLENIRKSINARSYFPWLPGIPDHIYLHYVLPIRVNNENLDSFRIKYYDELADRLRGFDDIEAAALEINHWCHEKVSYQGADIRTSAPMATILSTRGRCGEESTLTVAALRTVGIPARQIYVPRWAHSDDNHAWVEVWINGEWKYMGACEPEPILNHGWFTEAASRAMLIHTKSFGKYYGKDDTVRSNEYYAEINNLTMYADTRTLIVRVLDNDNIPVEDAEVQYGLFNYAEFYPIAETITDSNGYTSFVTGLGKLLVWCSKNGNSGFDLVSIAETDTLEIILGAKIDDGDLYRFNLCAPDPTRNNPVLSDAQINDNSIRLKREDSIRENYRATWIDSSGIVEFAARSGYRWSEISSPIKRSMGNYRSVISFLDQIDTDLRDDAISILNVLTDKDLRDTPEDVLIDHLVNARKFCSGNIPDDIFNKYVLNPRIANEIIKPWRGYLQDLNDYDSILSFSKNPSGFVEWIDDNVSIADERNYYNVPISPRGSIELAYTDYQSRAILFVALCRSYGIPARIEEVRDIPQYYANGTWKTIKFADEENENKASAELTLKIADNPERADYYTHFTLAYRADGKYKTLDYDYGKNINDFDWPIKLDAGEYMLVSGNRVIGDEVLSEILFFDLDENECREIGFSLRNKKLERPALQHISPADRIYSGDKYISLYNVHGKGSVIAWINHEKEPTKHFLDELVKNSDQLDDWGGRIILITDSTLLTQSFKLGVQNNLPKICLLGFDTNSRLLIDLFPEIDPRAVSLPVLIFVNPENEIIFKSEGYQIGLIDQIMALISAQKN